MSSLSIGSALSIATSGLEVAQAGLHTVANNIANVNTPGYVREVANQSAVSVAGQTAGVTLDDITRATNQFLEAANLKASSDSASASVSSSMLDQAQSLFGDPTATTGGSLFGQLDQVFSAFSTLAANPSATAQSSAVGSVTSFLNTTATIGAGLTQLSGQADGRIGSDITKANTLLTQISQLNATISQATVSGGDATGAQNQQSALVNQLSGLMNVTVAANATGGVTVRASDGSVLASDRGAASFSYDGSGPTGQISFTSVGGQAQLFGARLGSGELAGLMSLRNSGLPSMTSQLANLTNQVAGALNTVSNSYSTVPAPASLTGRNTGMDLATDVSNFTGKTNIAVVNASGVVQTQVAVDFSAGTMSVNGGAAVGFTPSSFLTTLNSQFGGAATAGFSNGALGLKATASGTGLVVSDDATTPSSKAGQSFSAFFGLNDLVRSAQPTNYDTGLTATSASGFPAGQSLTLRLTGADGSTLKDVTVTTPAGGTVADLMSALNDPVSGVGLYGAFQLNATGELGFAATGGSGVSLSVKADNTTSAASGTSVSQLFGIGASVRNAALGGYSVRADIAANPTLLQTSAVNLSAATGTAVISAGDTSAADAFAQAGQATRSFDAAGDTAATSATLTGYASSLAGAVASRASAANTAATNATAVASETSARLSSTEGVNVDQEMISLTTYQQAYSASARLVQACQDMFTALLNA